MGPHLKGRRLPGPISQVSGTVEIPSSKSLTNRALVAAAAADGGRILRPLACEDTRLLADALQQAGWPVRWDREIVVDPRLAVKDANVNLGNSGTGSRLILGLLACVEGRFRVDGSQRLRERPMQPLITALESIGSKIRSEEGHLPVEIEGGKIQGGSLEIRPGPSSQFVSSLLLAAPLMVQGLDLVVKGPVPSRPYLDLTCEVLEAFGASVSRGSDVGWRVGPGGLRETTYAVEGDWSAVAFAAAAVAVAGGVIEVGPLAESSSQGDRALCAILQSAGVGVSFAGERVTFSGKMTRKFEADLTDTPDLFPALSVVAATGPVGSVLRGLDHLKHKESDRRAVMIDNLGRLGAVFQERKSSIRVVAGVCRENRPPMSVTAADDHRIAMAMAVAALAVVELDLDDADCVAKSYPGFWPMWDALVGEDSSPP